MTELYDFLIAILSLGICIIVLVLIFMVIDKTVDDISKSHHEKDNKK